MNKEICILGAFAFRSPYYDGQTIKTRNLLSLLQNKGVDVSYFDTQDLKFNRFSIIKLLRKIITCKTLYYLPAQNNLEYLFPIIYLISILSKTKIQYFVVGGWLVEFLHDKPAHRKKLSKIGGIHCETRFMKDALEKKYNFNNVDVFPNFRVSDFMPTPYHEEGKLKLVFLARVVKMKGIDTIFSLCEKIRDECLSDNITIDFYGPRQDYENDKDGSKEFFDNNIQKFNFAKYCGTLSPSNINSTLEKYDVMLLPTHYYTEGLPGSILDAYMSGIPIIVTKWKYATEFVEDGKSGIIIPFEDDGTALFEAVIKLYKNYDILRYMKNEAKKKWHDYSEEVAWELLCKYNSGHQQ